MYYNLFSRLFSRTYTYNIIILHDDDSRFMAISLQQYLILRYVIYICSYVNLRTFGRKRQLKFSLGFPLLCFIIPYSLCIRVLMCGIAILLFFFYFFLFCRCIKSRIRRFRTKENRPLLSTTVICCVPHNNIMHNTCVHMYA